MRDVLPEMMAWWRAGEVHGHPDPSWVGRQIEEQLERLTSPIGVDLAARTPEETAISIAPEIFGHRWAGRGQRLAELDGRIHHEPVCPTSSTHCQREDVS